jgi:hypothetical protein|tara:strand:- start:5 stop:253 length:249 start_codon:yes stop_codon:yes gene_type:complete
MQATKDFSPSASQVKRIECCEELIGKEVYLIGTKYTTKVKGVVKSINIVDPKKGEKNIKITFNVLWDDQKIPHVTNKSGFEI